MSTRTFGYAPDKAERVKDQADRLVNTVEDRIRRLEELVPGTGTTVARLDEALEIVREVHGDLNDRIDEMTDTERGAW